MSFAFGVPFTPLFFLLLVFWFLALVLIAFLVGTISCFVSKFSTVATTSFESFLGPFFVGGTYKEGKIIDRIPSNTPGAEPPRDARDSGSARSHSMHLETSSSDRPKMVTYMDPQTVPSYMSVTYTRRTLRMPNFTLATHAQPSLSNFPWRDSDFSERTCSRGMTQLERNCPTSPQNQKPKLTHCSIYVPMRTISIPHTK